MEEKDEMKKLKNRIDWFCANRVNAFSPTISPAPKSPERGEIESIDLAVRYFRTNGVREIVVQRKYMGSYCDVYLTRDLADAYFVSRNGYKINHIDLDAARESCRALHGRFDWSRLALVIIQSEMMPWSILGKGLIDSEFLGYLNCHQNHYSALKRSDLYEKIAKARASEPYMAYIADRKLLTDKEIAAKYPPHICRQYNALTNFNVLDLQAYGESIDIYDEQITHFGREGTVYFKPFNILKKVYDDGSEELVNDNLSYREVNDDAFLHLPVGSEAELESSIERVYEWFGELSAAKEEGIVIKPREAFLPKTPPALKIRNSRYLIMIYGVDFRDRYDYYLNKRNIRTKLDCSINDWALNRKMLDVKYKDINKENYYLKNLVYDRIMGEKVEAGLDTRL